VTNENVYANRRIQERKALSLTIDYRTLDGKETYSILNGEGYLDLNGHSLALTIPRRGMRRLLTRDLSLGGLSVCGAVDVTLGTSTAVDIHLPQDPVLIKVLAKVVWVNGCGEKRLAGLRFSALGEDSRKRLQEFIGDSTN
jgi:hypothetical protein